MSCKDQQDDSKTRALKDRTNKTPLVGVYNAFLDDSDRVANKTTA